MKKLISMMVVLLVLAIGFTLALSVNAVGRTSAGSKCSLLETGDEPNEPQPECTFCLFAVNKLTDDPNEPSEPAPEAIPVF